MVECFPENLHGLCGHRAGVKQYPADCVGGFAALAKGAWAYS